MVDVSPLRIYPGPRFESWWPTISHANHSVMALRSGDHSPLVQAIGGGSPIVVFKRHRNSTVSIGLAKTIAALSPGGDKKPRYVAEYSPLIGLNRHMLLPIKLPSDCTWNAATRINNQREALLHRYIMLWRLIRGHPSGNTAFAERTPMSSRGPHVIRLCRFAANILEVLCQVTATGRMPCPGPNYPAIIKIQLTLHSSTSVWHATCKRRHVVLDPSWDIPLRRQYEFEYVRSFLPSEHQPLQTHA